VHDWVVLEMFDRIDNLSEQESSKWFRESVAVFNKLVKTAIEEMLEYEIDIFLVFECLQQIYHIRVFKQI
jgi:predicted DNA-binding protein